MLVEWLPLKPCCVEMLFVMYGSSIFCSVFAITERSEMGLYDVPIFMSFFLVLELVVVVVRLPRPKEGNRVTPIFRSLQNCQFHHRRLESLEHLMCLIYIYIYPSEHYGISFFMCER